MTFSGRAFSKRGSDVQTEVEVTFEEAVFGCDKLVHLQEGERKRQSIRCINPGGVVIQVRPFVCG